MKSLMTLAAAAAAMGWVVPASAQSTAYDRCCQECSAADKAKASDCAKRTGDARESCNFGLHKASKECFNRCVEQEQTRREIAARAQQRAVDTKAAQKRRAAQQQQ